MPATSGRWPGFMMQKGLLVVCGDAADGVADSMYAGTVFLGGKHGELGADAVFEDVTAADRELLAAALERWQVIAAPAPASASWWRESDSGTSRRAKETCGNQLCDRAERVGRRKAAEGPGQLIDSGPRRT